MYAGKFTIRLSKHIIMHPIDLKLEVKKKNIMPPRKILTLLDYDHATVKHTM